MRNTGHVGLKLDGEDVPKEIVVAMYSIVAALGPWKMQSLNKFDNPSGSVSARGW